MAIPGRTDSDAPNRNEAVAWNVRPARNADREALLALRVALWPDRDPGRHERDLQDRADAPARCHTLVLETTSGEVRGFAELTRDTAASGAPGGVRVDALFVAPPARRRGGAGALLDVAERWAHARGAQTLVLDLGAADAQVIATLRLLGFGEPERRVRLERKVSAPIEVQRESSASAPPAAVSTEPVLVMQPVRSPLPRVVNALVILAAVASFLYTDIFSNDPVRGLLLPLLDVLFVLYFMFLFMAMRYRRRADSSARAERLFRGGDG